MTGGFEASALPLTCVRRRDTLSREGETSQRHRRKESVPMAQASRPMVRCPIHRFLGKLRGSGLVRGIAAANLAALRWARNGVDRRLHRLASERSAAGEKGRRD